MYQKILVAVEGSESSKRALEEALRIESLTHGNVLVVYVLDRSMMFTFAGYDDPLALHEEGRRVLEYAKRTMAASGVLGEVEAVETEGAAEDVATCLQRCAQRYAADLVVMGTHGRRGAGGTVIGSVAERFLRFATCPVLLIRSECCSD